MATGVAAVTDRSRCESCPAVSSPVCTSDVPWRQGGGACVDDYVDGVLRHLPVGATLDCAAVDPSDLFLICEGWAALILPTPTRPHPIRMILPGEFHTHIFHERPLPGMQIKALTRLTLFAIPRRELSLSGGTRFLVPGLRAGAWREAAQLAALLSLLGRGSGPARIAYLVVSTLKRLGRWRLAPGAYPFPLRRDDIADLVGLTPVHVSRLMHRFRRNGTMELGRGVLHISRPERLLASWRFADEPAAEPTLEGRLSA